MLKSIMAKVKAIRCVGLNTISAAASRRILKLAEHERALGRCPEYVECGRAISLAMVNHVIFGVTPEVAIDIEEARGLLSHNGDSTHVVSYN